VSGNLANQYAPVVICIPLTTTLKRYAGNPILEPNALNGLQAESEIMVIQLRSLSKKRLKRKIGRVEELIVKQLKQTIVEILTF
jgi:mRNA interferase MazF